MLSVAGTVIVTNDWRPFVAQSIFELDDETCNPTALATESDAPTRTTADGGGKLPVVVVVGRLSLAFERERREQCF